MLEIKPLSYFVAAYEEKSISAAAVRCFIAQPSISHAIKTLEDKLSQQLFIRSKSGIMPTAHGHKLYEHAKALIEHSKHIEHALIHTPDVHINVYFQGDISLHTPQPLIAEIKKQSAVQLHRVAELNQADIAIIDNERVGKRFEAITLYQEGFAVLMNNTHPLTAKKSISLNDLTNFEFIERPYCSQRIEFQNRLKAQSIELNMGAQADNDLQVMELVELGFGIAAMPSERAHTLSKHITAKTIELDFSREVVLAYRSSRQDIKTMLESINWEWIRQSVKI